MSAFAARNIAVCPEKRVGGTRQLEEEAVERAREFEPTFDRGLSLSIFSRATFVMVFAKFRGGVRVRV